MRRLVLLLAPLALLGCDRPFVEERAPTVTVVEPAGLEEDARAEPALPLALRATSFRAVTRVEVNGAPMRYHDGLYRDTLALQPGLNALLVAAYDEAGVVGRDTLWALHLPARFGAGPAAPEPRGGWASVALGDGRTLFSGGAADSAASPAAWWFDGAAFVATDSMRHARAGHTLSRLPDGRVLVAGGSQTAVPASLADLVRDVEVFDPAGGTFAAVAFQGEPIERAYHTAAALAYADGRVFVVLYGGLGNVNSSGERRLGTRGDVRYFELRSGAGGDTLVARSPRVGPILGAALAGHTQTPLPGVGPDGYGRYLVTGFRAPTNGPLDVAAFALDFRPGGLYDPPLPLPPPRRYHAAAPLALGAPADGLVLVAGGLDPDGESLAATTVYADAARRFFRAPEHQLAVPRWGAAATLSADGRILLVGGFGPDGRALTSSETFPAP